MRQREKVQSIQPHDIKECTFHPKIGNADDVLIQTNAARLVETEAERFHRLSRADSEAVDRVRTAISESYYSQFTFRPELNDMSKVRGKGVRGRRKRRAERDDCRYPWLPLPRPAAPPRSPTHPPALSLCALHAWRKQGAGGE